MALPFCNKGDKLICSVCSKKFTATDDTKYIINGGYVCDWSCFLSVIKEREKKKKLEAKQLEKAKKEEKTEQPVVEAKVEETPTKKRGRPKKQEVIIVPDIITKKRRGRPKKQN